MKIARKIVGLLITGLVVLIVLAAVLINVFGDRALKIGIEKGAQHALKVGVQLDGAGLSILAGKLHLKNLVIDNPEGYQHPHLLTLGHASMAVNIGSLLSDTVDMEKIQLDDIRLTLEQKGLTSNLQDVLNNLPQSDAPATPEDKPSKNLRIRELYINGVEVNAKLLPIPGRADTVRLRLAPMTLTNIGTDEEIDVAQLTGVILAAIAGGLIEQGKDLLPIDMLNNLSEGVLGIGEDVLRHGLDLGKGILEGAGDVGKTAGDAIRGIFQRNEQ